MTEPGSTEADSRSRAQSKPELAEGKVQAEAWESNPLLADFSASLFRDLRSLIYEVRTRGCPVNLCFALNGDQFVNPVDLTAQKIFIDLVVAMTTTEDFGNYCAVQYGRMTLPISKLQKMKMKFLNKVHRTRQVGGYDPNVQSALPYEHSQLTPRLEHPRKIILFSDGWKNIDEYQTRSLLEKKFGRKALSCVRSMLGEWRV